MYDYCVISTGSTYTAPIKCDSGQGLSISSRRQQLEAAAQQLASVSSVLIVGGGAVGVELAAEIVGKYGRSKKVILVTNSDRLLPRMPEQAGKIAHSWLQRKGVQVITGQRVQNPAWDQWLQPGCHEVSLGGGSSLTVDLVYCCVGVTPHMELLDCLPLSDEDREMCRDKGWPVDDTLKVKGQGDIYACGDCVLSPFEANGFNADLMANLVADNIRRQEAGRQLQVWPQGACAGAATPPAVASVSLYKYSGVAQFNKHVTGGLPAALLKAFIEFCLIKVAEGSRLWWNLWMPNEMVTVAVGKFLFR